MASLIEGAPTGITMNSWKSTLLSACLPPLRMLAIGSGRTFARGPPRYAYKGRPLDSAAAFAAAILTASIALAPSLPLLFVPSSSIMVLSMTI